MGHSPIASCEPLVKLLVVKSNNSNVIFECLHARMDVIHESTCNTFAVVELTYYTNVVLQHNYIVYKEKHRTKKLRKLHT